MEKKEAVNSKANGEGVEKGRVARKSESRLSRQREREELCVCILGLARYVSPSGRLGKVLTLPDDDADFYTCCSMILSELYRFMNQK